MLIILEACISNVDGNQSIAPKLSGAWYLNEGNTFEIFSRSYLKKLHPLIW